METIELILEIFKPIFKFVYLSLGYLFTIKWLSESKWLRHRKKLDLFCSNCNICYLVLGGFSTIFLNDNFKINVLKKDIKWD